MNKAYKYRLYPTEEQETLFLKTFGSCRYVYNKALFWRKAAYDADRTSLSYGDTSYGLTALKRQLPWLKEVDSIALQQSLRHLDTAYKNFFTVKGARFPKFKSKRSHKKSYTTINQHGTVSVLDDGIRLPKVGKVKAAISRKAPAEWNLKSATVSMAPDHKFYVSVLYEYETVIVPHSIDPENLIAFDYKSDGLYVDSNGGTCGSPKYYRKALDKLAKEQRKLARKIGSRKGEARSGKYIKQQVKVNRIYRHIANQRLDFLHKLSTGIANRYDAVCVESLDMKAISNSGFGNGKATLDNSWGMFVNMLEYKLHDRGKHLVKVDRWFPSSQLCSCCGYRNPGLKDLSIREWVCPACGAEHGRDHNSAVNTLHEGLRLLLLLTSTA